jgi:hypothetical protein
MGASSNLDWLFALLGWALGLAGAGVMLWALFWDRSRGRRRCPRCWYDVGGIPGLVCPECGSTARRERVLLRTRRRPRWAVLAALLIVAGGATGSVPGYREGGWVRLVPSTALVLVAPVDTPPPYMPRFSSYFLPSPMGGSSLSPPPLSMGEQLEQETWRRVQEGRMATWQAQRYLDRHFRAFPQDRPGAALDAPSHWPVDYQIPVRLASFSWSGLSVQVRDSDGWNDEQVDGVSWVLPRDADAHGVTVHLRLCAGRAGDRVAYRETVTLPIERRGTATTFLDAISTPEIDRAVKACLAIALEERGERLLLSCDYTIPGRELDRVAVFFRAELRQGGAAMARARGGGLWAPHFWHSGEVIELERVAGAPERDPRAPLELVIRGDQGAACEAYLSRPFQFLPEACWAGEVSIPLGGEPGPAGDAGRTP